MGKLDFSFMDKRCVSVHNKKSFCGYGRDLEFKKDLLEKSKIPYKETVSGSMSILEYNGFKYLYSILDNKGEMNGAFANACKSVLASVEKFKKEHGKLDSGVSVTSYVNQGFTTDYVLENLTEISLVDVSHCYWRIAYNFGLIDQVLYEKYKSDRDIRLKSIGCLNKPSFVTEFKNGEYIQNVIENKNKWAWDFIVYKSYQAVLSVKKSLNNNIFAYQTDGVYLQTCDAIKASEIFNEFNLPNKVVNYIIVGYYSQYIVLENKETGLWKRANLGITTGIKKVLRKIDKIEYEKNSKE